jgi:uncharacterized protein YndB with AHSA1/START domain
MAVEKDGSGRRRVQVEVEVPGTPEEVWAAIATAGGISSWFVPARTELDADGRPTRMILDFGPGMESVSTVTDWSPPESFAADSKDLGEDAPVIATQWFVESKGGGICVVRVVHSLFASTDDWDDQLEGWESGWPSFFRLLRLYLAHFPGQASSAFQLSATTRSERPAAWTALTAALGLGEPAVGERCQSTGSAPALAGAVARVGDASQPEELVLVLDTPAPGIAHLFAMNMGGGAFLSLRLYLYGENAERVRLREEPRWRAWMEQQFPPPAPTRAG